MKVKLIRYTSEPVDAIENAASKCYKSEPTDGKIMRHCYNCGHHSVLEHVVFTWEIDGVSRALLAQLTRHRVASFSVQSQRYVSMDNFEYVIPPRIIRLGADAVSKYE